MDRPSRPAPRADPDRLRRLVAVDLMVQTEALLVDAERRVRAGRSFDGGPLRAARAAAGWSQQELATRAGISRSTLARLEGGHARGTHRATIDRLAAALGVPPEALLAWRPVDRARG